MAATQALPPEPINLFRGKVLSLSRFFPTQSSLAQALEVDRSRVSRWLRAEAPDRTNRAKVDALEFVLSRLTDFLEPATARKWLLGVNAHLGNRRAIELLRQGRVADVIAAIEQADNGAYS
ncbi:MAG: hypothetical protein ACE5JX_14335 [Acidobacteriota bacterium]